MRRDGARPSRSTCRPRSRLPITGPSLAGTSLIPDGGSTRSLWGQTDPATYAVAVDGVAEVFREAMAGLCSGVAVVTAQRSNGEPCGLLATSVSAFSAAPPSVLTSIGHASRCHNALIESTEFGVHLLRADQEALAHVFADPVHEAKFEGLTWDWDAGVPELGGVLAYLHCRRSALFELYDHSILIGDVTGGRRHPGEPLVYMDRRMDWRLERGRGLPRGV